MIFPNGAIQTYINATLDNILYNTGDQVWFKWRGSDRVVVAIQTHDGLFWDEETPLGRKP